MRWTLLSAFLLTACAAFGLRLEPLPELRGLPPSGTLSRGDLADLALTLSTVPAASRARYRAVLDQWSAEFRAQVDPAWTPAQLGERVLLFLHTHLKTYVYLQTRLDVLIDRGTFNCVSSALAYMILGRDAGLDVQAVATTDHAFALVRLPGGREVDVETTTAHGFDPGTKSEFTDAFGQTGFAYVPPGNYSQRRTIGDRQLLGLLVQNRMAEYQRNGQAEEAVGPAIDRWVVEGTPEAQRTLIDGFVNYAGTLNTRREYLRGLDLVDQMVALTGPVDEAKQLVMTFLNNHVNLLLDRQDWAGAQALTVAWQNRGFLTAAQAGQILTVVADRQLTSSLASRGSAATVPLIEQAYAAGRIAAPRRLELLGYAYGREVEALAAQQGPQAAWTYLGGLPAEIQALPVLVQARRVYAYNWSVEVHNRFAEAWNSGRRDEARQLLAQALKLLPSSDLLKKDQVISQGKP